MKNIFKFMGVALLASSMLFLACGKDNTDENTNNDNNTQEPEVTYTLTLKVNDAAMGAVTAAPAKEAYKAGDTVVLTATANDGFEFANWSDGNEENPRTIVISANATYTAQFVAVVEDHANITFGSTTWEATLFAGHAFNDCLAIQLYQNYQDATKAHVYLQGAKATGSYAMSDDNPYLAFYYTNDGDTMEYNGRTDVCVWQPASFSQNITAIDLNELTIAFTAEAELVNFEEFQEDRESATWNDLSIDFKGSLMSYKGMKMAR